MSEFVIEGSQILTWQDMARVVNSMFPLSEWDGFHLDQLEDILWGGFGEPEEGYVVIWRDSAITRQRLGHQETARWLEEKIERYPDSRGPLLSQLEQARQEQGPTLFDEIVRSFQTSRRLGLHLS